MKLLKSGRKGRVTMTRDRNPAQTLQNLQTEYEIALAAQEAIETYLLASSDDFLKPEERDLMEGAEGLVDLVVWQCNGRPSV